MRMGVVRKKIASVLIILLLVSDLLPADSLLQNKIVRTNLIGSTAIVAWGIMNWDYGKRRPHIQREMWFGRGTKYAGADKMGHFYTTYALTFYLSALYRNYGYSVEYADKSAALSSFFFNAVMEVGDSFSDYGFSYEDMIFNVVGSWVGYLFLKHPAFDKAVDIRLEYKPSEKIRDGKSYDILTDYQGMKFLAALKLDAFDALEESFLRWFELQAGYYVRRKDGVNHRYAYIGVGINFSMLLAPVSKKVSRFTEFYQLPYGYVSKSSEW